MRLPSFPKRGPIVGVPSHDGPFDFPRGFLWGAATADQQIESAQASDWTAFEQRARAHKLSAVGPDGHPVPGNIVGADTVPAQWLQEKTKFDDRMAEDMQSARAMGHNAHRFSISWARLFPRAGMSAPDAAGLAYYDRLFDLLEQNQLQACVTLFHFASPAWLWEERNGKRGVERDDAVEAFRTFVQVVAQRWGGRVALWCTLNEPMVWTYFGYAQGVFPPLEKRKGNAALKFVVTQLLRMHVAACVEIRKVSSSPIGIAQHARNFLPRTDAPQDRLAAYFVREAFYYDFLDALDTGVYGITGLWGKETIDGLKQSCDYIGVNYYGRFYCEVRFPGGLVTLANDPSTPREEVNEVGWCLDEAGFVDVLKKTHDRYRKPIHVLENGIADRSDSKRPTFLVRHAHAMWAAMQQGVDVRGYFHWSLIDNFEWAEGFVPRFGLQHVDYDTGLRTPRASSLVMRDIATHNTISSSLWQEHKRKS
jgi:beta-glucosidase